MEMPVVGRGSWKIIPRPEHDCSSLSGFFNHKLWPTNFKTSLVGFCRRLYTFIWGCCVCSLRYVTPVTSFGRCTCLVGHCFVIELLCWSTCYLLFDLLLLLDTHLMKSLIYRKSTAMQIIRNTHRRGNMQYLLESRCFCMKIVITAVASAFILYHWCTNQCPIHTVMHYKIWYSCSRDYWSMSRDLTDLTWFDRLGQSKQSNKPLYSIQSNYTVKA